MYFRKQKALIILTVVLSLSVAAPALTGELALMNSTLDAIESAYSAGDISLDEKVRLQILAIKSPQELPDIYAGQAALQTAAPIRCGTPILTEIRGEWQLLSLETQEIFRQAFLRKSSQFQFVSGSGFFKLHYDTTGENPVPVEDLDSTGVPDFIEKCAAYLDTTLTEHLELGFLLPPEDGTLGGDSLYDIYFEDFGIYGYTIAEGPGPEPWNDAYSHIVLNSDFLDAIFPPNNDPEGNQYGRAKVTCAHEFHHACQYAYDSDEESWFTELDATHVEDIIFDESDDNYSYLDNFMDQPHRSLMENTSHAYGAFIWGMYLSERFDTSLMRAVWEGARYKTVYNSLSDTLIGRYGWTQDSAFADFTAWNFCTAARDDGLHYEEAAQYFPVYIARSHTNYPVSLQTGPTNPAGYAACYVQFWPGPVGRLRLTFNGNDANEWSAYVILSTAENSHQFQKIDLSDLSYYGSIEIPEFENYYRVVLVGVNEQEFSGGAFFNYSASVIPPYAVSSEVLTIDSAVYSGGERQFEYHISNTSPLSDVFDITGWDDAGWISPDTFDISLGPTQDSVVTIPVTPPPGTPVGAMSNMTFQVVSRGDTLVTDSQSICAKVFLQRGDLNFDGGILIDDVTYVVDYLFRGGPVPLPVEEAGDFTCDTDVNVSDLSGIVDFLFRGGGPPPCNPY